MTLANNISCNGSIENYGTGTTNLTGTVNCTGLLYAGPGTLVLNNSLQLSGMLAMSKFRCS